MKLFERQHEIEQLEAALARAQTGIGSVTLIFGEAGIGKTSVVTEFAARCDGKTRVLKGHCDPLSTPSPFAPLYDIARQLGREFLLQLEQTRNRIALFSMFIERLQEHTQPTVLIVEDVHWADDATCDLLKYVTKRAIDMRVLLLVTYRDDEADGNTALLSLFGELANTHPVHRLRLAPLGEESVRQLAAGCPIDVDGIYRKTGGNPFYVTEMIASKSAGVPDTVRDAVLARASRISKRGRDALELGAVIGSRIERPMLGKLSAELAESLVEGVAAGILQETDGAIQFRHELVREALLHGMSESRRRQWFGAALDAQLQLDNRNRNALSQLAHYADGAFDADAALKYGLAAANAAKSIGAHREAAAQYRRVIRFSGQSPALERAGYLMGLADECCFVDLLDEAAAAYEKAIALCIEAGDRLREGATLAALAWPLVRNGRNRAAEEAILRAVEILETLPPSKELASAYRVQAHLRMLDRDHNAAVSIGAKAIDLAQQLDDQETLAGAEQVVGTAMLVTGEDAGRPHLDRCIAIAEACGYDDLLALAYLNMGSAYGEQYRFEEAESELVKGLEFTRDRDCDHASHYMKAWLAIVWMFGGRWTDAAELATALTRIPSLSAITKIMALVVLGRVRARRGDPGAMEVLDEALGLASGTHTLQRLAPVRAARAESFWLQGDTESVRAEAAAVIELAVAHSHRWHTGEFSYWLKQSGTVVPEIAWIAEPYATQTTGKWERAAECWRRLGCPYEEARALGEGDAAAQLQALQLFEQLGAAPAAAMLRRSMRAAGVKRIPRGRRLSTRENPSGLTNRELTILARIAQGLSNAGIADELFISAKTVDHHVSAILAKLGVGTRAEAARLALQAGWLAKNGDAAGPK